GGADGELGGAAAEVDDAERAPSGIEPDGGAGEREPTLLLARQQLGAHAERLLGPGEEVVAVGGVAGRGGGDGPHLPDAVALEDLPVLGEDGGGAFDARRVEPAGPVDPTPEAGDAGLPLQGALLGMVDEEPDAVGADVDGADGVAHSGSSWVTSFRCSATQRPTGSSPPARCQA